MYAVMEIGGILGRLVDDVSETECRSGIISLGEVQFLVANG